LHNTPSKDISSHTTLKEMTEILILQGMFKSIIETACMFDKMSKQQDFTAKPDCVKHSNTIR
jgi:hypothetical protein